MLYPAELRGPPWPFGRASSDRFPASLAGIKSYAVSADRGQARLIEVHRSQDAFVTKASGMRPLGIGLDIVRVQTQISYFRLNRMHGWDNLVNCRERAGCRKANEGPAKGGACGDYPADNLLSAAGRTRSPDKMVNCSKCPLFRILNIRKGMLRCLRGAAG